MRREIIRRIFNSFEELERAVQSAKQTLNHKTQPPQEVIERIEVYEEILAKQRKMAESLCYHVTVGEWNEVMRLVQLINGLSMMIRDDARELLAGFRPQLTYEEREMMLS